MVKLSSFWVNPVVPNIISKSFDPIPGCKFLDARTPLGIAAVNQMYTNPQ